MSTIDDTTPPARSGTAAVPADVDTWPQTLAALVQHRTGTVYAYFKPACPRSYADDFSDSDNALHGCLTGDVAVDRQGRPYVMFERSHSDSIDSDAEWFEADDWAGVALAVAAAGSAVVLGLPWATGLPEHAGHGDAVVRDAAAFAASLALAEGPEADGGMSVLHAVAAPLTRSGIRSRQPVLAKPRLHRPEDPSSWPVRASEHVRFPDRERWVLNAVD